MSDNPGKEGRRKKEEGRRKRKEEERRRKRKQGELKKDRTRDTTTRETKQLI